MLLFSTETSAFLRVLSLSLSLSLFVKVKQINTHLCFHIYDCSMNRFAFLFCYPQLLYMMKSFTNIYMHIGIHFQLLFLCNSLFIYLIQLLCYKFSLSDYIYLLYSIYKTPPNRSQTQGSEIIFFFAPGHNESRKTN